jgi:hypothetical protein
MHLWQFWNIYKKKICDQFFVEFLKKMFIKDFSFQLMQKIAFFLWHHKLNQHIHIDNMYPFNIAHFNTIDTLPSS